MMSKKGFLVVSLVRVEVAIQFVLLDVFEDEFINLAKTLFTFKLLKAQKQELKECISGVLLSQVSSLVVGALLCQKLGGLLIRLVRQSECSSSLWFLLRSFFLLLFCSTYSLLCLFSFLQLLLLHSALSLLFHLVPLLLPLLIGPVDFPLKHLLCTSSLLFPLLYIFFTQFQTKRKKKVERVRSKESTSIMDQQASFSNKLYEMASFVEVPHLQRQSYLLNEQEQLLPLWFLWEMHRRDTGESTFCFFNTS